MPMDATIAMYGPDDSQLVEKVFVALSEIRHRGGAAAGIAVGTKDDIFIQKGLGTIYDVRDSEIERAFQALNPNAVIGNIGYTKNRIAEKRNAEPIKIDPKSTSNLEVVLTMDGYIVEADELKSELEEDYNFNTGNKTEIVGALLHRAIKKHGITFDAGAEVVKKLSGRGTFALSCLVNDGNETYMVALNDDKAFEPFCFGEVNGSFLVASESIAHRSLGGFMQREYDAAEMTICSSKGIKTQKIDSAAIKMPDGFQGVYFGNTGSIFQGRQIYDIREGLGRGLIRQYGLLDVDVVIPNPDSGWGVTMGIFKGMREQLIKEALDASKLETEGIILAKDREKYRRLIDFETVEPALIKLSHAVRTFQEGGNKVDTKFGAVDYILKGKKIAMGDDSTVRGSIAEKGSFWWLFNCGIEELLFLISYGVMFFPSFKEIHRGLISLHELAVQKAFKGDNPYDKSLEEINDGVAAMFMKTLSAHYNNPKVRVLYNSFGTVREEVGDCSFQALNASYPIDEKFWPNWLKVEVEKFHKYRGCNR